tara:strand:+ start:963 stop:1574 length:612 start_codon:yes stop_codon:yes gene_type:complete
MKLNRNQFETQLKTLIEKALNPYWGEVTATLKNIPSLGLYRAYAAGGAYSVTLPLKEVDADAPMNVMEGTLRISLTRRAIYTYVEDYEEENGSRSESYTSVDFDDMESEETHTFQEVLSSLPPMDSPPPMDSTAAEDVAALIEEVYDECGVNTKNSFNTPPSQSQEEVDPDKLKNSIRLLIHNGNHLIQSMNETIKILQGDAK